MSQATAHSNAEFAAHLVAALAAGGVRHAVTSPGSRNTPLVLAFAAEPRITVHTVLDERVAGFVALGIGRVSGAPAALLCTSGSAGAHYLPAAIEAERARVPLLAITADRPPELQGVGAPQTIAQQFLLGRHARWFRQVGPPAPGVSAAWAAEAGAQAVAAAAGDVPGPAHLNVAFREPLWTPGQPWPRVEAQAPRVLTAEATPDRAQVVRLAAKLGRHARGAIVCGPRAAGRRPTETAGFAAAVAALAKALGWPVIAEPLSGLRDGDHDTSHLIAGADAALRDVDPRARLAPSCVLRFGQWPTSKPIQRWLRESGAEQLLVDPLGDWHDPDRLASTLAVADPTQTCQALTRVVDGARDDAWLAAWRGVEATTQGVLAEATGQGWWHGAAVRALHTALPAGATLHVASSLAVRDLDGFTAPRSYPLTVTCNRGANGIDGTLATAWGEALATRRPIHVLVGDLAFLHDAGALLAARGLGVRATVVVLNNGGGGIFDHLPISQHPDAYEDRFATPQAVELEPLCQAAGASFTQAASPDALRAALATADRAPVHVIELPIDRGEDLARHQAAWAAVAQALTPPRPALVEASS